MNLDPSLQLALEHHRAGRINEAAEIYRQILRDDPRHAEALRLLGIVAQQSGQHDRAAQLIQRAIDLEPNSAEFHKNLADSLLSLGQTEQAMAELARSLELQGNDASARLRLASLYLDGHRPAEAIVQCRLALQLNPADALAHNLLGLALYNNGEVIEAADFLRRAIEIDPHMAAAHNNLGLALRGQGLLQAAIAAHARAIELEPDLPEAHHNLGLALLMSGDLPRGWKESEWRWRTRAFAAARRDFPRPAWDGSPLNGKTILLWAEQGLGDTLQFVRYVPLVVGRGARVVLETQAELRRLLSDFPGVWKLLVRGEDWPPFDTHCSLMSLPLIFGTELKTIPAPAAYLRAPAANQAAWKQKLDRDESKLKVGLCWAGGPRPRGRSLTLEQLSPLARNPDISFYTLQVGPAAAETRRPPTGMKLIDCSADLNDFTQTAALITQLDLIISVDTAVAHLAGAMGKPVLTLLKFAPDVRWMRDRDDSPWYRTMRLFRQPKLGDWASVIRAVAERLRAES